MRSMVVALLTMSLAAPAIAQDNGETVFRRCLPCHALGAGAVNKVGPHLNGIIGRPVAGLADYDYSRTLRNAGAQGQVWDVQTITRLLKNPRHAFPGTKMSFAGMTDRADIDALLDYLASFDANGEPDAP